MRAAYQTRFLLWHVQTGPGKVGPTYSLKEIGSNLVL